MVQTALKTRNGLGDSYEIILPHFDVSFSSIAWSYEDYAFGSLLEIVFTEEDASVASRVARICESTAPVHPKSAAVVIVENSTSRILINKGFQA